LKIPIISVVVVLGASLLYYTVGNESGLSWIGIESMNRRHVLALGNVYFDDEIDTIQEKIKDTRYFYSDWQVPLPGYQIGERKFLVSFITNDGQLALVRIWGSMSVDFDIKKNYFSQVVLDECTLFKEHFSKEFGTPQYQPVEASAKPRPRAEGEKSPDLVLYEWRLPEKLVTIGIGFADDMSSIHPAVNISLQKKR